MLVVKACHISTQTATLPSPWAAHRPHPTLPTPLTPRTRLARQAHSILESLAEWGFARQLRDALDLDPAVGTAHAIDLHDQRGPILAPRQIAHLALADVVHLAH